MMPFTNGYALLIGTGKTRAKSFSELAVANDINAIHTFLVNPEFCGYPKHQVTVLCDEAATAKAIDEGLDWLSERAQNDQDATIMFYYSGHGWSDTMDSYYLIQYDALDDNLSGTAYSAKRLVERLNAIQARQIVLVFDCCRAAGISAGKNGGQLMGTAIPKSLRDQLAQSGERVVFASSLEDETSLFNIQQKISVFTYYFLQSLQGANSPPGDTEVRVALVMDYVSREVSAAAARMQGKQTPIYELKGRNFPIALLRGGKGLGPAGWDGYRVQAEENIQQIARQSSSVINQKAGNGSIVIGGNAKDNDMNTGTITHFPPHIDRPVAQAPGLNQTVDLQAIRWLIDVLRADPSVRHERESINQLIDSQLSALQAQLKVAIEDERAGNTAWHHDSLRLAAADAQRISSNHQGIALLRFVLSQLAK